MQSKSIIFDCIVRTNFKDDNKMIPIEKNKTYTAKITDLSSDGNGIAKIDGFAVFVPAAVPGDEAEILVVKVKTSYAYGKILRLIKASEMRTEPGCRAYARCGGCSLRHCKYSAQLEHKRRFAENALRSIGGFKNFSVSEIIGANSPDKYRNKMVFPFGLDENRNTVYGFFRAKSHDIVPLDECALGDDINIPILEAVKRHMEEHKILPYDEKKHSGLVRRVFIRKSYGTGEIMAVVSVNGTEIPHKEELVKRLTNLSGKITSIFLNVNTGKNNLVLGDENILLYGNSVIRDALCGIEYEISPNSFFQVNPAQAEKLYEKAIEYADISEEDTVLDIYCGIGTISLYAAKYAKKVIGAEIVEAAVRDARRNALNNNIANAEFYSGSARDIVCDVLSETPDIVILDPPRKGSDEETLSAIAKAEPKRIVYVSCNPATLARDVKFLSEFGYFPAKAAAVDMFPHTTHVECVVLMTKIN